MFIKLLAQCTFESQQQYKKGSQTTTIDKPEKNKQQRLHRDIRQVQIIQIKYLGKNLQFRDAVQHFLILTSQPQGLKNKGEGRRRRGCMCMDGRLGQGKGNKGKCGREDAETTAQKNKKQVEGVQPLHYISPRRVTHCNNIFFRFQLCMTNRRNSVIKLYVSLNRYIHLLVFRQTE